MAPMGHASTQFPQTIHLLGSILGILSKEIIMAKLSQNLRQEKQRTQISVSILAQ